LGKCDPYECYRTAVAAYATPDGFLVLTTQQPTGEIGIECYGKDSKRATPSIPLETLLHSNAPQHARALLEWLHLRRHRWKLQRDLERSETGDLEASGRVSRTLLDYQRARFQRKLTPTKGNPDHIALLQIGRHYGFEALTADELEDCFNDSCPCGKDSHSADALKKLRHKMYERA
jgi:hypothetical protein